MTIISRTTTLAHATVLFYDPLRRTVVHIDPNGDYTFDLEAFRLQFTTHLLPAGYVYVSPNDFWPTVLHGPQMESMRHANFLRVHQDKFTPVDARALLLANFTLPAPGLSDKGQRLAHVLRDRELDYLRETCAVWSVWLIHMHLSRPDVSLLDGYNAAMASLTKHGARSGVALSKALNRFIRRFLAQLYSLATYTLGPHDELLVNGVPVPHVVKDTLMAVGPLP